MLFFTIINLLAVIGNTFRPVSPEMMLHSNQSKSKWDVRLHEPLKSTIGPDRQVQINI